MLVKIFPFQQSFHNFDVSFMCSNPVDDNKIMTIVSNGFQWFDNNHIVQRKRLQTWDLHEGSSIAPPRTHHRTPPPLYDCCQLHILPDGTMTLWDFCHFLPTKLTKLCNSQSSPHGKFSYVLRVLGSLELNLATFWMNTYPWHGCEVMHPQSTCITKPSPNLKEYRTPFRSSCRRRRGQSGSIAGTADRVEGEKA